MEGGVWLWYQLSSDTQMQDDSMNIDELFLSYKKNLYAIIQNYSTRDGRYGL